MIEDLSVHCHPCPHLWEGLLSSPKRWTDPLGSMPADTSYSTSFKLRFPPRSLSICWLPPVTTPAARLWTLPGSARGATTSRERRFGSKLAALLG